MTSSRRHHLKVRNTVIMTVSTHVYILCCVFLQSLMLQIAASWMEQEKKDIAAAKEAYLKENCPTPNLSGDQAALIVSTDDL